MTVCNSPFPDSHLHISGLLQHISPISERCKGEQIVRRDNRYGRSFNFNFVISVTCIYFYSQLTVGTFPCRHVMSPHVWGSSSGRLQWNTGHPHSSFVTLNTDMNHLLSILIISFWGTLYREGDAQKSERIQCANPWLLSKFLVSAFCLDFFLLLRFPFHIS